MAKLIHGGDIYTDSGKVNGELLDFSANINPFGMPAGVRKVLRGHENILRLEAYPDPLCRELTAAIAQSEGVGGESILCGAGASDIIYRLVYAARPKKAVVLAPCFAEYEQALKTVGCEVRRHALEEGNGFALTEYILPLLTRGVDMLFLCNPNNPTGAPIERKLLCDILELCRENNILLVLDECFNDFLDEPGRYTMKDCLSKYDNLIILRAFTKMYALAGLRLGYAMCGDAALLGRMYECGSPWGVSTAAQLAGLQALKEIEFVERTREFIKIERAFLKEKLTELGCVVYASQANYIFFRPHVPWLCEKLAETGILARDCGNYAGLSGEFCRIAVKKHRPNLRLLRTMGELV